VSSHLCGSGSGKQQSRVRKAPRTEPRAHRHPTPQPPLAWPGAWTQCLLLRAQRGRAVPSSQQPGRLYTVLLAPRPPAFPQTSRGLTDWWVFAVTIFTASGSHITRSLSEPTAIRPFRGYRLKIFAALVLVTATNWFSSIFPVACSDTERTKCPFGERESKSPRKQQTHSHTSH